MSAPTLDADAGVRTCPSCWRPAKRASWVRCGYCGGVLDGSAPTPTPEPEATPQIVGGVPEAPASRPIQIQWSRVVPIVIAVVFVAYVGWLILSMAGA